MTKLPFVCRRAAAAAGVAGAAFAVVACGASPAATSNGALATSVVAVAVAGAQAIFAWRQAGIQDAQRYAAVWPRVSFDLTTNVVVGLPGYDDLDSGQGPDEDGGAPRLSFGVVNKGVGPALVRAVRARLDSQPVSGADALVQKVYGKQRSHAMSSLAGEVLAPNEKVNLIALGGSREDLRPLRDIFLAPPGGTPRFVLEVCYCSVFEQCWWAVTSKEPRATLSCPHDATGRVGTW